MPQQELALTTRVPERLGLDVGIWQVEPRRGHQANTATATPGYFESPRSCIERVGLSQRPGRVQQLAEQTLLLTQLRTRGFEVLEARLDATQVVLHPLQPRVQLLGRQTG